MPTCFVGEASVDRADRKSAKGTAFDVVLRGYDKRQVDERLRILGAELVVACNALRLAQERAAMLEEVSRARSGADAQLDSNFGARVEKILLLAQEEAREVRRQADAAAAALVEQARAEAAVQRQQAEQQAAAWRVEMNRGAAEQDSAAQRRSTALDRARQELDRARAELERESQRVRAQAQAEIEQMRKAVAQEADELFKAATQEADEVCKAARAEAAQLLAQARAEANRLVTTATEQALQRERASAHELHQLSLLHNEINADLYRAKEVLDSLFGGTRPVLQATTVTGTGPSPIVTSAPGTKRPRGDTQDRRQARTV
jgi:cell division septum initiation protein DivIVA